VKPVSQECSSPANKSLPSRRPATPDAFSDRALRRPRQPLLRAHVRQRRLDNRPAARPIERARPCAPGLRARRTQGLRSADRPGLAPQATALRGGRPVSVDRQDCKARNVVEGCFNRMKCRRGLASPLRPDRAHRLPPRHPRRHHRLAPATHETRPRCLRHDHTPLWARLWRRVSEAETTSPGRSSKTHGLHNGNANQTSSLQDRAARCGSLASAWIPPRLTCSRASTLDVCEHTGSSSRRLG
jgi:hypothetical protein